MSSPQKDFETGSTASNGNGAESKKEKKKEKLVLKKPSEKNKRAEYKQWYKSYMIKVTNAPMLL